MPTRPAAERRRPTREQTREHLLDAAERVFAEQGLDGASLIDVATAAGLTKGAVYSNFPSKEDLVLTLMQERISARVAAASQALTDDLSAPGVAGVGRRLQRALSTDVAWQRLFLDYWGKAVRDPDLRRALGRRRRELRGVIANAIRAADPDALRNGRRRPSTRERLTPEELAVVLLALSNGFAIEDQIDSRAVPGDLFARVLSRLVD